MSEHAHQPPVLPADVHYPFAKVRPPRRRPAAGLQCTRYTVSPRLPVRCALHLALPTRRQLLAGAVPRQPVCVYECDSVQCARRR